MAEASRTELLVTLIAGLLADSRHVAVGAASPIPAAGALLARECSGGRLRVSLLGSRRYNPFTDGARELFDCAAQGRIDTFFLGGVQIDGRGRVNLLGLGRYPDLDQRFSGNFGGPFMAAVVPNLILFREQHDPRTLVDRLDFVSTAGGARWLLTGRCLFRFRDGGFELASLHPGQTVDTVRTATGFSFAVPDAVPASPLPDAATLARIRGPVRNELAEVYPQAAAQLGG
jgi:glutaconate CoA-transferase subunit B